MPYWKVRFSCPTDFTPKILRQKQCAGAALETETPSRHAHEGRKIKYSMKMNTMHSCFYSSLSREHFLYSFLTNYNIKKSVSRHDESQLVITNS